LNQSLSFSDSFAMHGDVLISGKMIEGVVTRAETTNCRRAAVDLMVVPC
jgi:hypothetical protein